LSNVANGENNRSLEIKKMFKEPGAAAISLYEPTAEDVMALKELLGVDNSASDSADDLKSNDGDNDEQLRVYSISKDNLGNIYTYEGVQQGLDSKYQVVRNDSIRKEDVDAGFVWVQFNKLNNPDTPYDVFTYELEEVQDADGNYFKITKKDVIAKVGESAIIINENEPAMTVACGDNTYNALFVQKEKFSYTMARSGIELPDDMETVIEVTDIPVTDEEKKAAGELTDTEKVAQTRKIDIAGFSKWLLDDRSNTQFSYVTAQESNDSQVPDLFDVAWKKIGTVGTSYAKLPGLNISTTTTIASAHHFEGNTADGGNDFYYVKQNCVMNNGISTSDKRHWYQSWSYDPVKLIKVFENRDEWYWVGGAECDEFFLSHYDITSELEGSLSYPNVNCIKAKPEAYNKVTTTTVTHEHSVGAEGHAGTSGGEADIGLSLNYGYKSTKSESYQTYDIENTLNNSHNRISWNYHSTKIPHRDSPLWTLSYPAALTTSTFQPVQYYIWQIPTSQRSAYNNMKNTVSVTVEGAYSRNSGSRQERHNTGIVSASGSIELPKPPLFCLSKSTINFDEKTAKTDYVVVYSQGSWDWDKSTVPNWLSLAYTPNNSQLTVVAQPNDTGAIRTATINVQRGDGSQPWDKRTITVTQSPYSK